ncbi:hypothetical protein PIB30_034356 [Stylosanthes scabra]|uniref:TIR domain-containing protein n=1 Tax=Stylosanthes scabra TaxID=79078 RepID=A0ABU6VEC7_9FABA|nr:hypothetical protein [Stylosanthes scabra]
MESVDEIPSAYASWSWTLCLFTIGVFLGTFMQNMFLSLKSSLESKLLRALLGYFSPSFEPVTSPPPPLPPRLPTEEPSTSKSSERGPPSSLRNYYKYDVFLSCIGTDSSGNFTRVLNQSMIGKGISTFKVDKKLDEEVVDPIPPQHILQAIIDSRICIVVFSRDYARSSWCLEEMATIVEFNKYRLNQVVFPVYYDVERRHVRRQLTGAYQDAFVLHLKKFKPHKVDRWKKAMDELTIKRSAWFIIKNSSELVDGERLIQGVLNKLGSSSTHRSRSADDSVRLRPSMLSKVATSSQSCQGNSPLGSSNFLSYHNINSSLRKEPTTPYSNRYTPSTTMNKSRFEDGLVQRRPSMSSKVIKDRMLGQENPVAATLSSVYRSRPQTSLSALTRFGSLDKKFSRSDIASSASSSMSYQSGKSSSQQCLYKYDVFLSFFRGKSPGDKFANHLCNCLTRLGISTFRYDKWEEKEGECNIPSQILEAIKDSRISIVVLTRDYADSMWCLEEMSAIVDNSSLRGLNKSVIPIFYDLDPHCVQMDKRLARVHRWNNALTSLVNLPGGQYVRNKPKFQEIENVIEKVMDILGHKFSKSSDDLVGIQPRIECLENLLKLHSSDDDDDDFRVLGICGMDGIGKTTYASLLYDTIFDLFDVCCFIENVSQIYRDSDAIGVQRRILHQISNEENLEIHSHFEISAFIRKRLSLNHKVLIVLDNVDELEQLQKLGISPKFLGRGSRMIITTRDEHILKVYGADEIHKVSLLNYNDAHELFLRQALKDKSRNNVCVELIVPKILEYAQGLPLAIKSLGSFFSRRDYATVSEWEHAFEKLRKNPNEEIMDIFRVSFEELRPNEKEIFLHIACFFCGERVEHVKRILDCCGLFSSIGIHALIKKSLVTIQNKEIHMHRMLQEFGRKMVRDNYPENPEPWNRLWLHKDFEDVLTSTTGTNNNVKAVVLSKNDGISEDNKLRIERLSNMKELKLLILYHENFSGELNFLSNNLRYLSWHGYPFSYLPLFEPYSRLVELNLPNSRVKQLWKGHKNFPYLERMDLSNSMDLEETPNFEGSLNLKRLDFTGCKKLSLVNPSIGLLTKLVYLSLSGCINLTSLNFGYNNDCKLSSLRVLRLSCCTKLASTPDFRGLSSLKYLDLEESTHLLSLHESISALPSLEFLSLRGCKSLVEIPSSINNMASLQILDVKGCINVKNLPGGQRVISSFNAIEELRCLEGLNLQRSFFSYVHNIHTSDDRLSQLEYLNLKHDSGFKTPLDQLSSFDELYQWEDILKLYPHRVIIT